MDECGDGNIDEGQETPGNPKVVVLLTSNN